MVVATCLFLGTLAIALPVLRNHGFPLDDSWIYQVIGRNAARFGVPGFTAGIATSGSSSTIWPWIIAVNYRLLPAVRPEIFLLSLNVVFFSIIGIVLLRFAGRDRLDPFETVIVAALPAATGNFAWLLSSGMEHLLFIAAAFLAALLWLPAAMEAGEAQRGRTAYRSLGTGALLGISMMARPEAVIFVPLFLGIGWYLGKARRELLLLLLPCLACAMAVAWNNWVTSHALIPVTASGRRWMFVDGLHEGHLALAIRLLGTWAYQIVEFFYGLHFAKGSPFYKLLVLLTAAAMLSGVAHLYRRKAWQTLFLLLLAVSNFLLYCALLPAPGHAMRYQAMMLVFTLPLIALGVLDWLAWLNARWVHRPGIDAVSSAAGVAGAFALALASLVGWSGITDLGIQHINGTQGRMAHWLNEHLPPGTAVASFDIGAIAYFGGVRVIDLGGLIDPGFVPYLTSGRASEYLRQRHVNWLVLSAGEQMRAAAERSDGQGIAYCDGMTARLGMCDSSQLRKEYVVSFQTPWQKWDRSFQPTLNADQAQVLYRISWR